MGQQRVNVTAEISSLVDVVDSEPISLGVIVEGWGSTRYGGILEGAFSAAAQLAWAAEILAGRISP